MITLFAVACSVCLYLTIGLVVGDIDFRGLLSSIIIPAVIAPLISFYVLRVFIQLIETEEALRKSESRYRHLVENISEAIFRTDNNGVITYISPSVFMITGYQSPEICGRWFQNFVFSEDIPRVESGFKHILSGETGINDYRILKKNGDTIWVRTNTRPVYDETGVAGTQGVLTDINDLKSSERALEESGEQFRRLYEESLKAQKVYRSLLQSSADAIVTYDLQGKALFASPSFSRMFGYTNQEVIGSRLPQVMDGQVNNDDRSIIGAVIEEGASCRGVEARCRTKDDRALDISLSASRFDDHEGNPAGVMAIFRDITDKKSMEVQLGQAMKMEAVGTLAGGIAHDFNNILQAITGYVELVRNQTDRESSLRHLDAVDLAAYRASDLVQRLMTFSRKVEPELKPMDLGGTVGQAVGVLERTIPKMIRIETEILNDRLIINGDSNQLERVLINLGANARDAMSRGGVLTIRVDRVAPEEKGVLSGVKDMPGEVVVMSVSDTGCGMDVETSSRIFEPFFTTKALGHGTGLGMFTVYGIVEGHGGRITCTSRPGSGTRFDIYFPRLIEEDGLMERVRPDRVEFLAGGRETVLVADDESAIRDTTREILEKGGYRVLTVDTGEEALERYLGSENGIDLVILDLGMPGIGGEECLKELLRRDPGSRVIVASGYTDDETARRMLKIGARKFLKKPYRLNDMLGAVRGVLDD